MSRVAWSSPIDWYRSHRFAAATFALAVASIPAFGPNRAVAQPSGAVQFRVDNDGFDFWLRPARRTDGEYSNGVRIAIELARVPLWRRLAPRAPPCADTPESAPRCSSTLVRYGQEMYTPAEDSQPYTYPGWRRQRPYGGWLYGSMSLRTVRRSTVRAVGVTLGVTGPPSLADRAQTRAHEIMRGYTSLPVGWDTQVRFEPGVILSASQRWLLLSGQLGGVRLFDASVGAGGSIGNILTNAEVGGDLRVGLNLSHPWRRARHRGLAELVGTIGIRGQAVAHNIFLDGNTVRPDRRVDRIPYVGDVRGSVGIRLGPFVLAYAVTERSREYSTGPRSHTFGSLVAGIGGIPDGTP